jgi:hypothetical protein
VLPAAAVGKRQDHVIGAGIAIHGYPVEGLFHTAAQHGMQLGIGTICASVTMKTEHGGHIRHDHPRPLGNPNRSDVGTPSISIFLNEVLGTVSVVIIARAASSNPSDDNRWTRRGNSFLERLETQGLADNSG